MYRTEYLLACLAAAAIVSPARAGESWVKQADQLKSRKVTTGEVQKLEGEEEKDTRNKLSMRRINPGKGAPDWNTDPTAIPFMLYQVNKRTNLPVHIDNDGLKVGTKELFENLIIYVTSHEGWGLDEKETEYVSKWLKRGGTFLMDDCYNKGSPFSDCVAPETGKLIPNAEAMVLLSTDPRVEDVFSMLYRNAWPGENLLGRSWLYFMLDGRPAVFFTPNDDGCGWEVSTPPTASNPIGEGIGHGGDNRLRELFYQWITSWMMYVYSH